MPADDIGDRMKLFSWLSRGPGEKKSDTWDTFQQYFSWLRGTGGPTSAKEALEYTTVNACARVYGNGLAQVPFKLMRELPEGGSEPAKDHPLYRLLTLKPNEWQTSFLFRQSIGLHLAMSNNAYVFKVLGVNGKILELLPFPPDKVSWKQLPDRKLQYRIQLVDGSFLDVPQELMWHLRYMSWDGISGMNAVIAARSAIGLAQSAEEHGEKFYSNGARVAGLLSTDGNLNSEQVTALRESWNAAYGGIDNAGKTAILYGGLKYQAISQPADQSQFNETRRTQDEAICRGFGVMPIMVGISDKAATYASAESMFQAHVTNTLMPFFENFEQSAMVNLLSDADLDAGLYCHLAANALLRGNTRDRGDFYWKMWQMGALNPNEIRAFEEQNPYVEGDKYYVPINTRPTDEPPAADKPADTPAGTDKPLN